MKASVKTQQTAKAVNFTKNVLTVAMAGFFFWYAGKTVKMLLDSGLFNQP